MRNIIYGFYLNMHAKVPTTFGYQILTTQLMMIANREMVTNLILQFTPNSLFPKLAKSTSCSAFSPIDKRYK